jgi:WS/DGAT/MGAT family acyltransferase
MQQLNGTDAGFLEQEKGNVYLHVAGLAIYDPSTAPGKVRFKDILRFFQSRIALDAATPYRRQLVSVPLSLDRPYWIEADDFDIEFHVRHIALPQPGDWRQLMIQVARIHARPLDRSHPLWEAYVIEGLDRIPGLPKGSFAIFTKIHHAVIDGQLGAAMLKTMHSLTPAVRRERVRAATSRAERVPRDAELVALAVVNSASRLKHLAALAAEGAGNLGRMAMDIAAKLGEDKAAGEGTADAPGAGVKRPVTRFNAPISASRVIEAVDFPLDGLKRIAAKLEGATLNDVYLAVVGGAMRRYLEAKGELPATTLNAMVPISLRERADQPGNQISLTVMDLRTEIADALERLAVVHRGAARRKQTTSALGKHLIKGLLDESPVVVSNWVTRNVVTRMFNMTVSNVRGPDVPLYLAGARLVRNYPVSAIADYVGLNVTAFSYNGVFSVCAVADRAMMPDPAFFADCLRESYGELQKARRRK